MAVMAVQAVALLLGGTGLAGTLAVTAMPQWRVSAFIESNLIVLGDTWEGLWVHCSRQPDLRMLCQPYASALGLSPALRAARALMCVGMAMALMALLAAILAIRSTRGTRSMKSTRTTRTTRSTKSRWSCWTAEGCGVAAAGLLFLLSGVTALIPLCWVAKSITSDFYNPWVNAAQKRELGAALYLGWGAALCLLAAGSVFCCLWSCAGKPGSCGHSVPHQCPSPSLTGSSYSKSQYV